MRLLHLLEPEETIGNLWHRLVGGEDAGAGHSSGSVSFDEVSRGLGVFFRGLGGEPGVELKPARPEVSHHRLTGRRRLGARAERVARTRFDGDTLSLPDSLEIFPERARNEELYYWLAAWAATGGGNEPPESGDPLARDIARVRHAARTTERLVARFPGLARRYRNLSAAVLRLRPRRSLPKREAALEAAIQTILEEAQATEALLTALDVIEREPAPLDYKTYLPVPLWGELEPRPDRARGGRDGDEEPGSGSSAGGDGKSRRAKRRETDQINRRGGLFVHRFEKILTWTEQMNLHRDVEDDDAESARKAADDHDEIGVGKLDRKAATRLKIDLDLAPSDVDHERLSDVHTYPEWDYRSGRLLPDQTRILERDAEEMAPGTGWIPGAGVERRIRNVRRQFEALRPKREVLGRQLDGHELDMDALIRAKADVKARGEGSDHIYRQAREAARDLSVAVLIDVSRSTESYVDDRMVLDLEREALVALAEGLDACGDESAIFAFSSLRRDRVFVSKVKDFSEAAGSPVRARIAGLRPGFYTRLGAAIRHASAALAGRTTRKRLLLVLTDGKPNDLDHYEGRYGIEDTRHAVHAARQAGQAVFGITIDAKAQSYFPRMFGAGGFAVLSHPSRLTAALPILYRTLVS